MSRFLTTDGRFLNTKGNRFLTVNDTDLVIDDFEGDRNHLDRNYNGSTGSFTIDNGSVSHGRTSLRMTKSGVYRRIMSMPGDGLPHYPEPGDRWRFRMRSEDARSVSFGFFKEHRGDRDQYEITLYKYDNEITLTSDNNGNTDTLITVDDETINNGYYEFEVGTRISQFDNMRLNVIITQYGNEIAEFTYVDTADYLSGSGIQWSSFGIGCFDYFRLVE